MEVPAGFTAFVAGGSKFFDIVDDNATTTGNFRKTLDVCQSMGGNIAMPKTQVEMETLWSNTGIGRTCRSKRVKKDCKQTELLTLVQLILVGKLKQIIV